MWDNAAFPMSGENIAALPSAKFTIIADILAKAATMASWFLLQEIVTTELVLGVAIAALSGELQVAKLRILLQPLTCQF